MKAAPLKPLQLDDQLAEAHTLLGIYSYWYERDLVSSQREFKRAIELDSKNSEAHHQYGNYLVYTSRFDEGIAEMRLAQRLAPLDLQLNSDLAQCYVFEGVTTPRLNRRVRPLKWIKPSGFPNSF